MTKPIKSANDKITALDKEFSAKDVQHILRILTGNTEDFTPYNQMIKTIMDDRYVY